MVRILVVDDEASILDIIAAVLEDEGYETVQAGNGHEALAVLAQQHVDLVLSDVMMPFMDGRELALAMQREDAYRGIPVVLATAGGPRAVDATNPAAAVLAKPFTIDALLATVARALALSNA